MQHTWCCTVWFAGGKRCLCPSYFIAILIDTKAHGSTALYISIAAV